MNDKPKKQLKVSWHGYLALFIAIILFSGIFSGSNNWLQALDFNTLNGTFGKIQARCSGCRFPWYWWYWCQRWLSLRYRTGSCRYPGTGHSQCH